MLYLDRNEMKRINLGLCTILFTACSQLSIKAANQSLNNNRLAFMHNEYAVLNLVEVSVA